MGQLRCWRMNFPLSALWGGSGQAQVLASLPSSTLAPGRWCCGLWASGGHFGYLLAEERVCKGRRVFLVLQLLRLDLQRKSRLLVFLNSVLYFCMSAVCWTTVFQQFLLLSVLASGIPLPKHGQAQGRSRNNLCYCAVV